MRIATSSEYIDISSEKKTEEFAKKFQEKIKLGDVIFLHGEIGVGKTTFVRYLINHFQKINNLELTEVTSPTFNILNEYEINKIQINHYDLYRLKDLEELADLNLFSNNQNLITIIEWPQIINTKPKNLIEIFFKYDDDYSKRFLQIQG
mgnify:CR=1 FL=1|tara:strand:+ start:59 stop:505 length:447 start_codon:yes stop_codon:yes gene_type:complete